MICDCIVNSRLLLYFSVLLNCFYMDVSQDAPVCLIGSLPRNESFSLWTLIPPLIIFPRRFSCASRRCLRSRMWNECGRLRSACARHIVCVMLIDHDKGLKGQCTKAYWPNPVIHKKLALVIHKIFRSLCRPCLVCGFFCRMAHI